MTATENFAQKLKMLRERKKLSLKKTAEDLGVTAQSLSLYENGMRTINIDLLRKVAQYFEVSSDYLIGLSDVATTDTELKAVCDYTGLDERAVGRLRQFNVRSSEKEYARQFPKTTDECYKHCINIFIGDYLDEFLTEILDNGIDLFYLDKELEKLNKQLDDEFDGDETFSSSILEKIDTIEEKADFCRYQTERSIRKLVKLYIEQVNWGFMLINGNKQLLEKYNQKNVEEATDNGEHQTPKE